MDDVAGNRSHQFHINIPCARAKKDEEKLQSFQFARCEMLISLKNDMVSAMQVLVSYVVYAF